jgi:hypothetical protein
MDYLYYYTYTISSFLSDVKVLGVCTIKTSIQNVMCTTARQDYDHDYAYDYDPI